MSREELIEVMARASCEDLGIDWDGAVQDCFLHDARVDLAAIEAAGWVIVPPDDGR